MASELGSAQAEALRLGRRHLWRAVLVLGGMFVAAFAPQPTVVTVMWAGIGGAVVAVLLTLWAVCTADEVRGLREIRGSILCLLTSMGAETHPDWHGPM